MTGRLRRAVRSVRALFGRERVERELDEEVAAYLDADVERRVADGVSREDAVRAARRAMGSVAALKDGVRDAGWETRVDSAWRDVRDAMRVWRRSPGFTATAVLTLAIGIGLSTAAFAVTYTVLLRPLPFQDSDRLVWLVSNVPADASGSKEPLRLIGQIRTGDLVELRARSRSLSHVGVYANDLQTLTDRNGLAARLEGWQIEPSALDALGVAPILGRPLTAADAVRGADDVMLLSHDTWQRQFAGAPDVIGRTVRLGGDPCVIVGVMPAGFAFPYEKERRDFWRPFVLGTSKADLDRRWPMVAKLAEGVSLAAAESEVGALVRGVRDNGTTYALLPVRDVLAAPVRPSLRVFMAAGAMVLLIACVNVAGLHVVRGTARRREIGIRAALGAGRGRLIRQLVIESMLLAAAAAVAGLLFAGVAIQVLRSLAVTMARMDLGLFTAFPRLDEVRMDAPVAAFGIAAALLAGTLSGLAPAIRLARQMAAPHGAIGGGMSWLQSRSPPRTRTGAVLVVTEIALAMTLVVAGGLLVRSFVGLANMPLGYTPSHVLTFQVATPEGRYEGSGIQTFAEHLVERLRNVPGIEAAAYAPLVPFTHLLRHTTWFRRTPDVPTPRPVADLRGVSHDYFAAMGVRVLEGRGFTARDDAGQPRVVVINRTLARRDFGDRSPVGQTVYLVEAAEPWRVVGVVDDVRQASLGEEPAPQVFVDGRQWPGMAPGLRFLQYYAVRTAGDPARIVPDVRAAVRDVDPQASLYHVAPMDDIVSNSLSRPRLNAAVAGVFACVALALAAIGLFGLMAYTVSRRTREIGVRLALGARPGAVLGLVLRQSLVLVGIGMAIGLAAATASAEALRHLLFGVTPLDPPTFLAVSALFVAVTMFAAYLPARHATKIDPLVALRTE